MKMILGYSKILIFAYLASIGKNFEKINSPRPIFQNPNFESMDEIRKVMP